MPRIGDEIAGKYRLEKVAGEGGMGVVYVAEHLVLKQRVAVKVLLPDAASSEAHVERFTREARAGATINSEHVARVLDAGSLSSGAPFLVMEYLDGCDLEELLELQRTLPIMEVADYLIQALEGLAHAHAAGIVHRDLKPSNLFLACRPDGTNGIKLLDFGISKTTRGKPEDKRLTGHHVLGSPVYMSPEQLRNATDIDGRADLWSLGVVGYELLVGSPPFDGDGVGEIFAAILEKSPVPLCKRSPHVPADLSDVIGRCLRRDREERWENAGALARALAPFASDASAAIVERAEHVLARGKMLSGAHTPLETRRLVQAIEAAAERAMTSATRTVPPLPLVSRRGTADVPAAAGVGDRVARLFRRSPRVALAAGFVLAIVGGVTAFGATRPKGQGPAATPPPPSSAESQAANAAAALVAPPPAAAPAAAGSGAAEDEEPPLVMDLPEGPKSGAGSRAAKPTKPQRPKFLNSRE